MILGVVVFLTSILCVQPSRAIAEKIYFNGENHGAGYYVVPDNLPDDGGEVWVVVDVHGAGGLRNDSRGPGLAKLLEPEPVIVLVPSFTSGYQGGDGKWAEQLIENFETVRERYSVHDRMFVHGHSGGAQLAHRFAFNEPDLVAGVSAHSAGSWACAGGYGEIDRSARGIPFTISCGEKDQALSVPNAPHNRIDWYRLFAAEMEQQGFVFRGETWPEAGHGVSARLYGPGLKECFLLSTRGEEPGSGKWSGKVEELADEIRRDRGVTPSPRISADSLDERDVAVLLAANEAIGKGRRPDTPATLCFLTKYPVSSWGDDERFQVLKEHCRTVVAAYVDERRAAGQPLSDEQLERFRRATEGLGIETPWD